LPRIKVHQKALAHLSRGMYRSPASALRELVSNAWDAGATEVSIETTPPEFEQILVTDNGCGMTREAFEELMELGIGNSGKDPNSRGEFDRPTIGRLGIGMLGIAHICGSFTITSKTRSRGGFKAKIELYDLFRDGLDRNDPRFVTATDGRVTAVDVGNYEFSEDFDLDAAVVGTSIFSTDVVPTYASSFRKTYKSLPAKWRTFIREAGKTASIHDYGEYWRLLWELGACCPVRFVSKNALPDGLANPIQKRLEGYNFRVMVDGHEVFRPVFLSENTEGYTTHMIAPEIIDTWGISLRFNGYLVVQEAKQLRPDELRGVLIRIREVAIGRYDPSLLGFPVNQGPRQKWLTGEIFVEEGLDDALNIDRDSFNQFHPAYSALRTRLHKILTDDIWSPVYKAITRRTKRRTARRTQARRKLLKKVAQVESKKVVLQEGDGSLEIESGPLVSMYAKKIEITLPDESTIKVKKASRDLLVAIMTLYDLGALEGTPKERRQSFLQRVKELLTQW